MKSILAGIYKIWIFSWLNWYPRARCFDVRYAAGSRLDTSSFRFFYLFFSFFFPFFPFFPSFYSFFAFFLFSFNPRHRRFSIRRNENTSSYFSVSWSIFFSFIFHSTRSTLPRPLSAALFLPKLRNPRRMFKRGKEDRARGVPFSSLNHRNISWSSFSEGATVPFLSIFCQLLRGCFWNF